MKKTYLNDLTALIRAIEIDIRKVNAVASYFLQMAIYELEHSQARKTSEAGRKKPG